MPIEIRHLRAFVTVAEELSFRRSSERLHTSQPALSRTISNMEELLGVRLFERSTRVVRLTPVASSLLPEAREVLDHLASAIRSAQRAQRGELGTLTVGFNDFTINGSLPKIIMRFRSRYPGINVTLHSMTSPDMAEMVRKRRLDIAFLTGAHLATDLESLIVRQELLVCLLPRGHPLAEESAISLPALAGEPFVMGAAASWGMFLDVVNGFCAEAGFRPRIVQEAENSDGIVGLVAAGVGVSIYVDSAWLKARRDIIVRPFIERPPALASVAAWHPGQTPGILNNFVEAARTVVLAPSPRHKGRTPSQGAIKPKASPSRE